MMDRVQKKCFIAATAFHGLLILILLFGSALMPSPPEETFHPITVYDPSKISDLLTSGGGPQQVATPTPPLPPAETKPAPPAPPPPAPKPEPVQRRVEQPAEEPEKVKVIEEKTSWWNPFSKPKPEAAKETKDTSENTEPKPHKHQILLDSSDVKTTRHDSKEKSTSNTTDDSAARAARRQAAREFNAALRNISKNMSSSTIVDMPAGDGSSAEASVNYNDIIASKYYNAWVDPTDLDDSTMPVVLARVTISRSGDIVSARVVEPSGNRAMDRSIENVLETVRFIEPFPDSFREEQRTVTIRFNLKTKKQLG